MTTPKLIANDAPIPFPRQITGRVDKLKILRNAAITARAIFDAEMHKYRQAQVYSTTLSEVLYDVRDYQLRHTESVKTYDDIKSSVALRSQALREDNNAARQVTLLKGHVRRAYQDANDAQFKLDQVKLDQS